MQRSKKIVSLFFLSIFSVILLHQVLPHVHHQHHDHDVTAHFEDGHHHHDGQGHHHEDENEKGDEKGLLNLLLGAHSHLAQVNEVYFFRNNSRQAGKIVKVVSPIAVLRPATSSARAKDLKQVFPSEDEFPPWRHYVTSRALRGPPALG